MTTHRRLPRVVGLTGAVLLGLGSMLGTGVFVTLGLAAGVAGSHLLLAVLIAGALAAANGLSLAQLAARYPESGGTYEYGYRQLNAPLGFTAGFMFVIAKSASAATAALGAAGYLLALLNIEIAARWPALLIVAVLTAVTLTGLRRSNAVNTVIVAVTLLALLAFIAACLPPALSGWNSALLNVDAGIAGIAEASALVFVAFTGYGRVATLGEEIREPQRSIPRAVLITVGAALCIYLAVAAGALGILGPQEYARLAQANGAPLERAAVLAGSASISWLLALGAVTAMLGVLLNLILGVSRVLLAMARRSDMPQQFARLNARGESPTVAIVATAALILLLTLIGSIKLAWSLSAFTVLVYYSITNLAALRLRASERAYPLWISYAGLAGCLLLACFIELPYMLAGLALILAGLCWHFVAQRIAIRQGSTAVGD